MKLIVRKTNNTIDFNVYGAPVKRLLFPLKKTMITNVNCWCFDVSLVFLPAKKH